MTNLETFREGFSIGGTTPVAAIDLVIAMRGGAIGTTGELAALVGKHNNTTSDHLWSLHRGGHIHIKSWRKGWIAVFAYGKGADAIKPISRNLLRIERRARRVIERREEMLAVAKARIDAFMAEPIETKVVALNPNQRHTAHGVEETYGAARIHRMR